MNYVFSKLLTFTVDHGYFAGTDLPFLEFEPTAACAAALARMRLLYRAQQNGGVVLYEVDTTQAGLIPLIDLEAETVLTFIARTVHVAFAYATDPIPLSDRPFYFSNHVGALESGIGRPHAGTFAGTVDQVRLVPPRTILRYQGFSESETLRVVSADGSVVFQATVVPVDGVIETTVNVEPWAPSLFEVRLGTEPQERIYADASLSGQRPVALLDLVLRPAGNEGFGILDAEGRPFAGGVAVRARWQERATIWRYVVVPRADPDLHPEDIRLQHVPEAGSAFEFTNAGTQTLPPDDAEAVLFESTTLIGLRAVPYRGLALQTRPTADAEFASALTDLPNPRPEGLSLASTAERPISEVFVYL